MIWVAVKNQDSGEIHNYLNFQNDEEANLHISLYKKHEHLRLDKVSNPNMEWLLQEQRLVEETAGRLQTQLNKCVQYNEHLLDLIVEKMLDRARLACKKNEHGTPIFIGF